MKAAAMVMSIDALSAQCAARGGFAAKDTATLRSWTATQRVDAVRARAQTLRANAVDAGYLDAASRMIVSGIEQGHVNPCKAAVNLAGSPDAQFSSIVPGLSADAHARATPPRPDKAGAPSPLLAQIDSFGFDTAAGVGYGGFITTDIFPVVLFRDGRALTHVADLGDVSKSRRLYPEHWTQWRRSGGRIELKKLGEWDRMAFAKTYASLPPGFRLNGHFSRLTGTGNVAFGGNQSVALVRDYRFWPDGSVVRGATASAAAAQGTASVITRSAPPDARGHYRIDGLSLTIAYDNGAIERRIIVADPSDPKTAIWLDGESYTQDE